ncbi:hypothetical protein [Dehalobacter sp. 14DCB1]|uniref:hypothetical protein n=1 Tax=Dehalobacter sp. 14DCB1 TaxID=2070227 RepID=UPI0010431C2B|nr:hypothetical protein [Dehalobacter sp. 14DCB1]TCX53827.1 hypothetical protein C1I36_03595 [Dehalobacter sp. 14DCB1]
MTISNLTLSYPDFVLGQIINPDEFDQNNDEIVDKINELVNYANTDETALTTHKTSNDHDGRYYTETELNNGQLDNRYYTEVESDAKFATKSELSGVVLGQIPPKSITTNELNFDPATQVELDAVASVANNKASFKNGTGTFTSGGTSYQVTDAFITANTMVTVSPTGTKVGSWTVQSYDGYFIITSDATESSGVTFDWGAVK